jgi:glycosyltransferase involved in cell wall biosynthesis
VIPAFNEEKAVAAVVDGCRRLSPAVYVVDDGSTDRTGERAAAAGAVVVRHEANRGKGAALGTGMQRAAADGFEAVAFLDADGQHDPGELPALLAAAEAGADVVVGCRRFDAEMPLVRRWTNRLTSWILSRLARRRLADSQSGFRVVRVSAWPRLRPESARFAAEGEMLVRAARAGLRIAEVPVKTNYAGEGSHVNPLTDAWRFLALVLRLAFFPRGSA